MAYAYIYEFNNTAIQLVSVHYALCHCHRFLTASWLSNSGPLFRLHCACDPLTLLLHLTLTVTPEAAGLPQCCFSALTWAPLLWCSSQLCSSRWWLSQWHWFCLRWEKHTRFYFFFSFFLSRRNSTETIETNEPKKKKLTKIQVIKVSFLLPGTQDVSWRRRKHEACTGRVELWNVEERPGAWSRLQCRRPVGPGSELAPVPRRSAELPWQQSLVMAWSRL